MTRVLITSALPYINGIKHLGNLVGSMLPADVYARYMRSRGHDVLFLCATDEHGAPAELAAAEAGLDVAQYCAEMHEAQAKIYREFNLSFDHFGRSSSAANAELTRHFFRQLEENGFVEERIVHLYYSVDDDRYLPDRYIVGTCPHCGYTAARGDQCESCTRVLDPVQLLEPRSAISGSTNLTMRESRHLFLKQSRFVGRLRAWIDQQEDWPPLVRSIAYKWLDVGLEDRCITRDLRWGIPVDRPGFEGKVFYVWFDAPIEYIGATKEWADMAPRTRDWKGWWTRTSDVRYVQFMAKDNIPFHTVSFPCTIMGSDEDWILPSYIKGVNWLNYYGGKFSTSQRHGIFMDAAVQEFPADYYRYWLMSNAPENSDSTFTWSAFASGVNKDLADVLGNFVNRCLKFTASRFGSRVPQSGEFGPAEIRLERELTASRLRFAEHMESMQWRKAMAELREIWVLGNMYLDNRSPWKEYGRDVSSAGATCAVGVNLVQLFAQLAWPVIPSTAEKILDCLVKESAGTWPDATTPDLMRALKPGHSFTVPEVLFEKITPDRVCELVGKYGGDEQNVPRCARGTDPSGPKRP